MDSTASFWPVCNPLWEHFDSFWSEWHQLEVWGCRNLTELCARAERMVPNVHFTRRRLSRRAHERLAAQYPWFVARTIRDVPLNYPLHAWRLVCVEEFRPDRDMRDLHRLLCHAADMHRHKRLQNKPMSWFKTYNETARAHARGDGRAKHRASQLREEVADAVNCNQ